MSKNGYIDKYTLFKEYLLPNWEFFAVGFPIYTGLFFLYLEASPKLGNIWMRTTSEGIKRCNLGGFIKFFYEPFRNSFFWKPQFWDLNIYVGSYIFVILLNGVYKYFT